LGERDIVFTTFATAWKDFKKGSSPLARVHWFRIVLDEGIEIQTPTDDSLTSVEQRIRFETAQPSNSRQFTSYEHSVGGASLERQYRTVLKTLAA